MSKFDTRATLEENIEYIKGSVLDLGCGRSKYKHIVLANAGSYLGVDKYKYGNNVEIVADAQQVPFSDNSFDTILCLQVLEHVSSPIKVVNECYRVLKLGGKVIITTPWIYPYHGEPEDYYRYSRTALEFMFSNSGFEILKLESKGGKFRIISVFAKKWIKNRFISKYMITLLEKLDIFFNKSKTNLDTPSHLLVAQKK
jgi:ubiquinone/menaquinone biosynthesis C-methylase UbiE